MRLAAELAEADLRKADRAPLDRHHDTGISTCCAART
jgi:hypothetical protein